MVGGAASSLEFTEVTDDSTRVVETLWRRSDRSRHVGPRPSDYAAVTTGLSHAEMLDRARGPRWRADYAVADASETRTAWSLRATCLMMAPRRV